MGNVIVWDEYLKKMNSFGTVERPTEVSGFVATQEEWRGCRKVVIDHSENVDAIAAALDECLSDDLPLLVGVVGAAGAGKTVLASVLTASAANAQYVDVISSARDLGVDRCDLSKVLVKKGHTYIVDEAGAANQDTLKSAIDSALENGCTIILLTQTVSDFTQQIKFSRCFSLRHNLEVSHNC